MRNFAASARRRFWLYHGRCDIFAPRGPGFTFSSMRFWLHILRACSRILQMMRARSRYLQPHSRFDILIISL